MTHEATSVIQSGASQKPHELIRPQLLQDLERRLREAMDQARRYQDMLDGKPVERCFDRLDQATFITDRDNLTAQVFFWQGSVAGLEIAIKRVKSEQYGKCQTCSGDIEIEKLTLSPAADQCISCTLKEREEGKKKIN